MIIIKIWSGPPDRPKTPKPRPKPKKAAITDRKVGSAHVGRLAHSEEVSRTEGGGVRVDLSAREAARQAMLYHEIFSPPKALRQDEGLWEM